MGRAPSAPWGSGRIDGEQVVGRNEIAVFVDQLGIDAIPMRGGFWSCVFVGRHRRGPLDWEPKVDLEEGLNSTIDYFETS